MQRKDDPESFAEKKIGMPREYAKKVGNRIWPKKFDGCNKSNRSVEIDDLDLDLTHIYFFHSEVKTGGFLGIFCLSMLALLEVLLTASPTESRALRTLAKSKIEKSTGKIGLGQSFRKFRS